MKYTLLIIFISTSIIVNAQDTLLTYFDEDWKEVPKESAKYYRKTFKNENKLWTINDYFLNGQLQMTGSAKSKSAKKKHGDYTFYYENDKVKSKGKYVNGKKIGKWTWYYDSGTIQKEGEYGQQSVKINEWKSWYPDGGVDYKGEYLNGKKEGRWFWYYANQKVCATEFHENGKKTENHYWDEIGNPVMDADGDKFPEYVGGKDSLNSYIIKNITYPADAKRMRIMGTVIVTFVIDKHGKVVEAFVKESISESLDKEALRVIKAMPNWIPGRQRNRPVSVYFNIPIRFKL